jgi:hypothetical protein
MSTCLDLVRREVTDLSEKELDEVLEQMRKRQARLMADGADPAVASAQAGREIADTLRAAAAIEKRNAAINLRVRTEALDYIQTTWADDPAEGVLALLYGSPKARFGSRASANAAQDANFRKYTAGVAGELQAAGLFDVLRRGEMDRDVARAMWSINDPATLASIPSQAVEIAKVLQKWQEVARLDANRHGAWIGKLDNYVVRQSHSPDRLSQAGEAKWKSFILPRLDLKAMFPDGPPKNMDDWLHETYLNLTTGVRPKGEPSERMNAFKGPANLAKKLSQERVIHFKSADDWFDYNAQFGFGNLREAYVQGIHRSAESTGLMQVLGTNPEHNLDAVVQSIRSKLSRSDPKALKEFDRKTRGGTRIENSLKEVAGITRRVASQRLATFGAGLRVWNTLTGLGGAVVSAVTDVPIRASLLRYQGQSYLGALGEGVLAPIKRILGATGDAERKATLSAIGYFNELAMGNLAARFSPDESVPGRLQRATHTFFKWNLLGGWTDEMRRVSLESMGRFFGESTAADFASLSERTRNTLGRFRVGEKEWGVIRKGVLEESGGEKFLTPQGVREMDPDAFRSLASERVKALKAEAAKSGKVEGLDRRIQRVLEDAREDMANRVQQLYADEVNSAVINPDARTLAFVRQGQQAGTPMGEALRLFWQFKTFGIAVMQRAFLREFYGYGKGAGRSFGTSEIRGLATLLVGSLAFGYVAMSAKDMLKGRSPRPVDDYRTWQAAMAQGGGMGIYGDFMFGQSNRFGQGFLTTLGGPTVGKADEIYKLWSSFKAGDDVAAKSVKFTINNTPYANLFYTRMAADYLFLYEMQDAMNPGYLRRMERSVEEETGSEWWLRPSEVVN